MAREAHVEGSWQLITLHSGFVHYVSNSSVIITQKRFIACIVKCLPATHYFYWSRPLYSSKRILLLPLLQVWLLYFAKIFSISTQKNCKLTGAAGLVTVVRTVSVAVTAEVPGLTPMISTRCKNWYTPAVCTLELSWTIARRLWT